jgi:hypothetical protein
MRFRFSLRTLVALVTVVCIALWAVPVAMEWAEWRLIRASVTDTMSRIAASPEKPAVYNGFAKSDQYCLANVEVKWDLVTDSGTQLSFTPRSDAVFVEIPDKVHTWAHSPNEVMQLLRQAEAMDRSTE